MTSTPDAMNRTILSFLAVTGSAPTTPAATPAIPMLREIQSVST
jgi:hypothetical protein